MIAARLSGLLLVMLMIGLPVCLLMGWLEDHHPAVFEPVSVALLVIAVLHVCWEPIKAWWRS